MKLLKGMKFAYMNNKDNQLVYHINKHYNELTDELNLIKNFEEFSSNKIIKKAIILDLIQIGENVNKLSIGFQKNINKMNLKGIIGFRNHFVHGYGTNDDKIVWETIKNYLPNLISEINNISLVLFLCCCFYNIYILY